MDQQAFEFIQMSVDSQGSNVLLLKAGDQEIPVILSMEQLINIKETVEQILDPQRRLRLQIKNLKKFKRDVFTHYKQAKDPEIKDQKYKLYEETKKLIIELEQNL